MLNDIFTYLVFGALLPFAVRGVRWKGMTAFAVIALGAVYVTAATGQLIATGESTLLPGVDLLSALFLLAVAISGFSASLFATGYVRRHADDKSRTQVSLHFAALVALFYSMAGVVTAHGQYPFLLWWELMTLSSFLLVMFDGRSKKVLHAAIGYLVLMHIGFFLLLGAFAVSGSTIFTGGDARQGIGLVVYLLFFLGFGLKAGIFPLHMWLPVAHPAAPSHVSAMMSGVMIKMGVYGVMRATLSLTENLYAVGIALFALGLASALFGIKRASAQTDLKRLLAYSSIENIGIIFAAIGFGTLGRAAGSDFVSYAGYGAALIHMLGHSNYKTALFLGAGSVVSAAHTADMNRLGGLLRRMPATGSLFLVSTLAICAIAPLVGFASEFVLLSGMFRSLSHGELIAVSIVGITTLALVAGLAVIAFSKAFGITFLGNPRSRSAFEAREVPAVMLLGSVLPTVGVVAGALLYPYIVLENADVLFGSRYYAAPMLDLLTRVEIIGGVVIVLTGGLLGLRRWLRRRAEAVVSEQPTWGCAFTAPNKQMQYTASSFSSELQSTVERQSAEGREPEFADEELFPARHTFRTPESDSTAAAVTRYLSKILRRWTARLALFQTGKTNHYLLHALLLLVLILVMSLIGLL